MSHSGSPQNVRAVERVAKEPVRVLTYTLEHYTKANRYTQYYDVPTWTVTAQRNEHTTSDRSVEAIGSTRTLPWMSDR